MTYLEMLAELQRDPRTSTWLINATLTLRERDAAVALDDVDILYTLQLLRRAEVKP